jgi:undecaprenyl-diphosphatase
MDFLNIQAVQFGILSVLQGITELLPISSSGHLILLSNLWQLELSNLILSILHLGTTLAIILFLRETLFKDIFSKEKLNFYLKILVASIPAGLVGIFLGDFIENQLRATWIIAVSLIVWGIVMIVVEQLKVNEKDTRTRSETLVNKDLTKVTWRQSLTMGIAQTFALIPGTSRSGITTLAGIFSGLNKYTAFEYSFVLGIPVLIGASVLEVGKALLNIEDLTLHIATIAGVKMLPLIFVSFIVGYVALMIVKKYQKKNWLTVFGIYRIILGLLILLSF